MTSGHQDWWRSWGDNFSYGFVIPKENWKSLQRAVGREVSVVTGGGAEAGGKEATVTVRGARLLEEEGSSFS